MTPTIFAVALAALHVEVYTMGQGAQVFERFGHAAICVVADGRPDLTRCYNYGTTDFGSPPAQMGWSFLRGESTFWVSVWPLDRMLAAYVRADRTVWRQRLPLTASEVDAVRAALEYDALPEHRRYVYHHFRDNCSTRVRDVVDRGTGGRLSSDGARPFAGTYRDLGRRGLAEFTPVLTASDFLVGRLADGPLDVRAAMFLPAVLRSEITERFGVEPTLVYERRGPPFAEQGATGRGAVALVAAALGGLAFVGARVRGRHWLPLLAPGMALGCLGMVLWVVAAVSVVPELRWNEALLGFWPTDGLLPWLGAPQLRRYARLRVAALGLLGALLAIGVLRQPLAVPLLVPAAVFLALSGVRVAIPEVPTQRPDPRN